MPTSNSNAAPTDFDLIIGDCSVHHRRLNARLAGCADWTELSGVSLARKILGGFGNVEDIVLLFPDAEVRAAAFRSFDPHTRTWAIWWLDGRAPHQPDVPVIGGFSGCVGVFFATDTMDGRPIKVRFTWNANPGGDPIWE